MCYGLFNYALIPPGDTVSESVSGVEIKRKSTDFFRFVKDKTTNRKES